VDDKSLTQELRLTYDGESLSSIIGAFYEDTKLRSITNILTKSPARSTPLQSFGDRRGTDHAIFTHNIYQFDDRWTLTAGLRYSEVEKDARVDTLIAKKTRFIELLKEKRHALIDHAVTKGLNSEAPIRNSGVEWLGEIPAHWLVAQLAGC